MSNNRKTVLFFPLNSPGHINSSLGIADVLRRDFNCDTKFLLLGKMMGTSVVDRGHELIILPEAKPLMDFEIEDDEDPAQPVDEAAKLAVGKQKRCFEGVFKWPQVLRRYAHLFRQDPLAAFIASAEIMERMMVGELVDNHESYARAIDQLKPDLVVVDAYYIPPCVLSSRVPWMRLYSANPLMLVQSKLDEGAKPAPMIGFELLDKQRREQLRRQQPDKWQSMVAEWRRTERQIVQALDGAGQLLNKFLGAHGCSPPPPGKQAHDSPHLNVYMYPEALDYEQDDDLFAYPARWLRCDSLMRQQSRPGSSEALELDQWKARLELARKGKQALVFFSLGSLASGEPHLMRRFVNFLSADKRRLYVVSKGANGHKFELDAENMIGDNYIPQTYFLQQVDMAIIHGGNNSVTECMYYGKPMVVMPVFADQLDNAQRVQDLGYGRRLDVNACTQQQLLQAVDQILGDEQMLAKSRLVGQQMRARDDLRRVCKLTVELAQKGSLTQEEIDNCRGST